MKLAQIDTSVYYEVTIPSTKKKTRFRPFIVKEEKALLTAQESGDVSTMLSTLEEIVKSCVKDCPTSLTTFDIEYLFLQIRSKSVGEISKIVVQCPSCNTENTIGVDLTKVVVDDPIGDSKLKLNDRLIVQMKYPDIRDIAEMSSKELDIQQIIASSIDSVYFNNEVIRIEETTQEDLIEFLEQRTDDELNKLIQFVENIPTVKLEVEYECRQCAAENKITMKSLADFF